MYSYIQGSSGNIVGATTDDRFKVDINAGASVIFNVILSPSTAIAAGTVALTSDAAQLTAQACKRITLQSDPDNSADILIGTSASQPFQLLPGDSKGFVVTNLNLLYAKTVSSTATLNWIAETS